MIVEGNQIRLKTVIIGDGGVGKTSILKRYLAEGFEKDYIKTVGANFYSTEGNYSVDGEKTPIQWVLWDLGGQPTFNEVRSMYYQGAKAAILVFDISRPETYHNLPNWLNEFWENAGGKYPVALVANKIDLRGNCDEEVSKSMGQKYVQELSEYTGYQVPYVETSAKEDLNIDKLFERLVKVVLEWAGSHSLC